MAKIELDIPDYRSRLIASFAKRNGLTVEAALDSNSIDSIVAGEAAIAVRALLEAGNLPESVVSAAETAKVDTTAGMMR